MIWLYDILLILIFAYMAVSTFVAIVDLAFLPWVKIIPQTWTWFKVNISINSNTAKNHALEHHTLRIIRKKYGVGYGGHSNENGFHLHVNRADMVGECLKEALRNIANGNTGYCYSNTCGVMTGVLDGLGIVWLILTLLVFHLSFTAMTVTTGTLLLTSYLIGMNYQKRYLVNPNYGNVQIHKLVETKSRCQGPEINVVMVQTSFNEQPTTAVDEPKLYLVQRSNS